MWSGLLNIVSSLTGLSEEVATLLPDYVYFIHVYSGVPFVLPYNYIYDSIDQSKHFCRKQLPVDCELIKRDPNLNDSSIASRTKLDTRQLGFLSGTAFATIARKK